jgi:glutamate N-acetyltransferase/amino-acid N-acetyltransferase
VPCVATGLFTQNKIKAVSVQISQKNLTKGKAQAIVANSGCANVCTGEQGFSDGEEMVALTAKKLNLPPEDVLIANTGVIGKKLQMEKIRAGLEKISLSKEGGHELARAIMTTDTSPKEMALSFKLGESGEKEIFIGGIAKGAGMIHPNLATMFCFLTTDAAVTLDFLKTALKEAVDVSFNLITVDGDTSTNDMVLILANGLAGNETIKLGTDEGKMFQVALTEICTYLAKSIVRDGEGATKLIEVTVEGALTAQQCRLAARTIAGSPLVKTAIHGNDPNWGRIVAALGRSGAEVVESKIDLYLNNLCLLRGGIPLPFEEEEARSLLDRKEVSLQVCLNLGKEKATAWGCDLSKEYVEINSMYTT